LGDLGEKRTAIAFERSAVTRLLKPWFHDLDEPPRFAAAFSESDAMLSQTVSSMFDSEMQCFPEDIRHLISRDHHTSVPVFLTIAYPGFHTLSHLLECEPTSVEVTSPCIGVGYTHSQVVDLVLVPLRFGGREP
jgi:hypothetical protein